MTHIDPYLLKFELDYRRELAMASRRHPRRPAERTRRLRLRRHRDES